MVVCVCNNVNHKKINELLGEHKTLDEIQMETCAGLNCGKCLSVIQLMLDEKNVSAINLSQKNAIELIYNSQIKEQCHNCPIGHIINPKESTFSSS